MSSRGALAGNSDDTGLTTQITPWSTIPRVRNWRPYLYSNLTGQSIRDAMSNYVKSARPRRIPEIDIPPHARIRSIAKIHHVR